MQCCLHVCFCEGIRSPETIVADSCEPLCGCWELNLEEYSVLLTAGPSVQPVGFLVKSV